MKQENYYFMKKYELIVIQLLQKKLQSDLIPKYFISENAISVFYIIDFYIKAFSIRSLYNFKYMLTELKISLNF